eukprot:6300950-Prymnesium_polylepis.1
MSRTDCSRQGAEAIGSTTRRREGSPVFRTKRHPRCVQCVRLRQTASDCVRPRQNASHTSPRTAHPAGAAGAVKREVA